MSIRRLSYLSNIRLFKNSPLKFLFSSRDPKCPPGELDLKDSDLIAEQAKALTKHYEDTGPMTPLKLKQIHFQQDNGLPIHLKGGPMDRVLMGLTFVFAGVGLVKAGKFFFEMISGPSPIPENQEEPETETETDTEN